MNPIEFNCYSRGHRAHTSRPARRLTRRATSGQAGLLCALLLASAGFCPLAMAQERRTAAPVRGDIWRQSAPESVERGRQRFLKTCAFCHGPDANGGSNGPNLLRSFAVRHDDNGNAIGPVILDGRPDRGMPAFQLTGDQIKDVAAFLRYRLAEADRRSPNEPGSEYSAAKLLVGSAAAGEAFFNGGGGCSGCHSPSGDLRAIARKYAPAELQARFLYPQDLHEAANITDSSGRQYSGEIRLLTNYDVAIVDRAGWYRSWPLDAIKLEVKQPLAAHRDLLSKLTDSDMHNLLAYLETLK